MRLKEIYVTIMEHIDIVEKLDVGTTVPASGTISIPRWNGVREALIKLRNIDCLRADVDEIFYATPFTMEDKPNIVITRDQFDKMKDQKRNLCLRMRAIMELCESVGMDEIEYGFDVKLPPAHDFNAFAQNVSDFNQFLKMCPVLREEDTTVSLASTDVGSIWIVFSVVGVAVPIVLKNFAKVIEAGLRVRSTFLTTKMQEEAYRKAHLKNEILETLTEANRMVIKTLTQQCAEEIQEQRGKNNPEETNSLAKSIEKLGDLMAKGLEVYAAIDAPEEIKAVFPPLDSLELPVASIKQITEGEEEQ